VRASVPSSEEHLQGTALLKSCELFRLAFKKPFSLGTRRRLIRLATPAALQLFEKHLFLGEALGKVVKLETHHRVQADRCTRLQHGRRQLYGRYPFVPSLKEDADAFLGPKAGRAGRKWHKRVIFFEPGA
jgi:hypothetical protein